MRYPPSTPWTVKKVTHKKGMVLPGLWADQELVAFEILDKDGEAIASFDTEKHANYVVELVNGDSWDRAVLPS